MCRWWYVGRVLQTRRVPHLKMRPMKTRGGISVERSVAPPFGVDEAVAGSHRGVSPAPGDRLLVKRLRARWAEPQEYFERQQEDAQVIELSNDRKHVGYEIERGDQIKRREERHAFDQQRHSRLPQKPQREPRLREQCSKE